MTLWVKRLVKTGALSFVCFCFVCFFFFFFGGGEKEMRDTFHIDIYTQEGR